MPDRERVSRDIYAEKAMELVAKLEQRERELERKTIFLQSRIASGMVGSGVKHTEGSFTYEFNSNLRGSKRWDTYDKMESDPHVKGALRLNTLPLTVAHWEMRPASDSDRDTEIAEFCSANLLCEGGDTYGKEYWLQTSWQQRLFEILDMLRAGYSMFHKSFRRVGRKIVFDRLHWLEPETVDQLGWKLNARDEIESVSRTYTRGDSTYATQETVPGDQIALYPWELKGARFEGRPFIRSMYGPWYRKDKIQTWAAIWAQKVGAPVPIGHYPAGWPPEYVEAFQDFVMAMRGQTPAESFGMFPMKSDGTKAHAEYVGSGTDVERGMTSLINQENAEMAHTGGTKSEMLGETQTGSRAVAGSMSIREMIQIHAVAIWVAELETRGAGSQRGVIQELVDLNFSGVQEYPKLVCSKISPEEGLETFDATVKAWSAGIVPKTPAARRQISETLGLHLPAESYDVPEEPPRPPAALPGDGGGSTLPDQQQRQMSLGTVDEFRSRVAPLLETVEDPPSGGSFRGRNRLEMRIDLAVVDQAFRVGEHSVQGALLREHNNMIADLLGRLRAGKITRRSLESQSRSQFKGARRARRELTKLFREIGQEGITHVARELEAMRDAVAA